ncbi:TetR/AcrR family transcriptional regulator [Paenibacillus physcomitrellae]|uniref:HTH tetR-type domain-containing protein n=1 Tax=Paenibacillus physcomitrellae TaxID=1619311 RepID=A0ABQ1G3A5_9BACL|nr:TetR/AcrR family transcriptional regulator [Paenibacillus physcomitrellae]GGA36220.1 hypothetical protein GCM10010917_21780 [Paenibacillus physcomitrellae]
MRGLNAGNKNKKKMSKGPEALSSKGVAQVEDEYKKRILGVVKDMLHKGTFEEATMSQIAKLADIGQGSLYRRYANKGEISSELLRRSSEALLARLEEGPSKEELARSKGGQVPVDSVDSAGLLADYPSVYRLKWTLENIVNFIDEQTELLYVIKAEFMGKHQLTQFEHPFFERLNVLITALLTEAARRGEMKAVSPSLAANAIIAVVSPDVYMYQRKHYATTKEEFCEGVFRLFKSGLIE